MRILIHGINFAPELTGIGKYSAEMAQWLATQGHEVRVVTAQPYYPQWRVMEGYANWWSREILSQSLPQQPQPGPHPEGKEEKSKGSLVVYRCPLWVPARPSSLKRLLHLASFALSSFPIMLRHIFWRPQVVLVVEPPLFCAPQAWLIARLSGGKSWLHIQDYEVDAAFDLGLLKGAALRSLVATCERWLMHRFDRVSTISQRMVERAVAKGVRAERVVLLRNWVEIRQSNDEPGSYRAELGVAEGAVVALYSGNMGGKQGLEILAQTASLLRNDSTVVFVFCGNGAGRDSLLAQCAGLSNVRFLNLQPARRLSELLAMADIHLLPQRADAADLVMPSKLTGMLASARPVIATARAGTELAYVVKDCGLVVEPEQPHAFAEAIMKLARDAGMRTRLGASGRAYAVQNLDRDVVLGRFEAELRSVSRCSA